MLAAAEGRRRQGRILPQGLCRHLDSDPRHTDLELLASGTVKEHISVVFSHAVHGDLLQQSQGANKPLASILRRLESFLAGDGSP